jgi:filamentous hemagglutinin
VVTLTNADRAVIDARKLADYALNPRNPVGRHKARVFAAVLGFDRSNIHLLIEELRRGVVTHAAEPGSVDEYGARYRVDMRVIGPKGTATVRTAWIYRTGSDVPELVTLHVR